MEEEDNRKRRLSECECQEAEEVAGKRPRTPATDDVAENNDDLEQEDMLAWLACDEETVMELSKLLDSSETLSSSSPSSLEPFNFKVKFIDDPYTSSVIVQSSSAYVTINGNEESCGSSFSESESSVMASFDRGSFRISGAVKDCSGELNGGGAWSSDATDWVEEDGYVEGFFVSEMDGWDLLRTGTGYINDGGDDGKWENFLHLGEDLFGGSW